MLSPRMSIAGRNIAPQLRVGLHNLSDVHAPLQSHCQDTRAGLG